MNSTASSQSVRRLRRFTVALVVTIGLASLLLVGCEDASETPSVATPPAATPATATPGAPPPPISTAEPTPTVDSNDGTPYGLAIVDVETGEAATLHESDSAFFLTQAHDGGIVGGDGMTWLSPDTKHSIRYAADGTVVEEIEGWGVLESPDGTSRAYFVGDEPEITLVVEHDGARHELAAGGATWRAFSPDGMRLAWTSPTDPERGTLHLLEIETGNMTDLATGAMPPLTWSPSGQYLAYGAAPAETAILDIETGETDTAPGTMQGRGHWIEIDGVERLVTLDASGVHVTPTDPDEDAVTIPFTGGDTARVLGEQYVMVTAGTGPGRTTAVFDVTDGSRALELHGEADVVATATGLASAVIARTELACTGIEIVHPVATQQLPCEADFARWSPDGRYLALVPTSASAPVEVLDLATGESRDLPHAGPRGSIPTWSADGRYLVWAWMPQP